MQDGPALRGQGSQGRLRRDSRQPRVRSESCRALDEGGHFLDLSDKGSKAKAHPVAQGHPQAMEMQKVFPIARSDFQVMEQQCQGRERADIVGVVTQLDLPPTSKPKANLWLKDLSGKEMLSF